MKTCLLLSSFLSVLLFVHCASDPYSKDFQHQANVQSRTEIADPFDSLRVNTAFEKQVELLKTYIKTNSGKYSDRIAIMIDMRIPSRFNRMFVVDLKKDSIMKRMLVAHGSGSETAIQDSLQFSNVPNSYMSSLGTYKIGASYQGNFGRSFKLHGLEKTNSKAFDRLVVLHRYSCVPDEEQTYPICNSLGCPMVSENNFPVLEKYIDAEKKPVLLRIYY